MSWFKSATGARMSKASCHGSPSNRRGINASPSAEQSSAPNRTPRGLEAPPVTDIEQRRELYSRKPQKTLRHRRPAERTPIRPLRNQHHPAAVVEQYLHPPRTAASGTPARPPNPVEHQDAPARSCLAPRSRGGNQPDATQGKQAEPSLTPSMTTSRKANAFPEDGALRNSPKAGGEIVAYG